MGRRGRGEGSIFKPRGRKSWYFKCAKYGIKRESAGTESKTEAAEKLRRRIEEVRAGLSPHASKITLAELVRDKLAKKKKLSSYRNDLIRAGHLMNFFGLIKAKDTTTGKINDFMNWRSKQEYGKKIRKPVSDSEINREIAFLKSALKLGMKNQKIHSMPQFPDKLKEPAPRSGFFEWKQLQTLLRFLPHPVAQLCLFYYITGWRSKEGKGMRWAYVSFETKRIVLPGSQTKNGKPRTFPFTPDLESLLSQQREYTDVIEKEKVTLVPWVFHREGKQIKEFRRSWKTACGKAGLATSIVHSFRRTAVRNLELAGVPRAVAMQMVGMETESIYRRYRIVAEGEMQNAAKIYGEFEKRRKA